MSLKQAIEKRRWPIVYSLGYKVTATDLSEEKTVTYTFSNNSPKSELPTFFLTANADYRIGKLLEYKSFQISQIIDQKPYLLKEETKLEFHLVDLDLEVFICFLEIAFLPNEIAFWELFAICSKAESKETFGKGFINSIQKEYFPELKIDQLIPFPPFIVQKRKTYLFSNPKILNYLIAREINKKEESKFKGNLRSFISEQNYKYLNYELEGQFKIILEMIQKIKNHFVKIQRYEESAKARDFEKRIELEYLQANWPNLKNGDISVYVKRLNEME